MPYPLLTLTAIALLEYQVHLVSESFLQHVVSLVQDNMSVHDIQGLRTHSHLPHVSQQWHLSNICQQCHLSHVSQQCHLSLIFQHCHLSHICNASFFLHTYVYQIPPQKNTHTIQWPTTMYAHTKCKGLHKRVNLSTTYVNR